MYSAVDIGERCDGYGSRRAPWSALEPLRPCVPSIADSGACRSGPRRACRGRCRRDWTTRAGSDTAAFVEGLTLARGDGSYPKLIQRLARTWLLILDDWGLASLSGQGRHDLLKVLDDRYARRGTLLASQVPVEHWHDVVGDPTFGDAILDRLLNNTHRITLKGGSMRRLYDSTKEVHNTPGHA